MDQERDVREFDLAFLDSAGESLGSRSLFAFRR
jgi:hypothetical protein